MHMLAHFQTILSIVILFLELVAFSIFAACEGLSQLDMRTQ